ncbi:MAG: hypothetical protein IPJ75_18150 [Ignavibacteriales bacterium]|nr:hypothetical protein [Ignavibacteriales bacterium]
MSSNVEPLVKDGNIYFITSQSDSIYISTDLGVTWDGLLMGTTFLHNGETKDIFMASDFDVKGNRILLHAFTGMSPVSFILLESQDLGQTWSVSFIPQISEMIQKVGLEDDLAILCTYDSVYKKTEGGTWTSAVSGLPGPVTTNLVYLKLKFINGKFYTIVGGEVSGLFRFDGDSWVNMNATGYVTDFDFHNESLIASTSGKVIKLVENDWSSISDDLIATTTSPIPFNKDIVFSKSGTVLYRTTNGGTSWDSVANSIGKISFRNNELFSWDHTGVISSTDFGSSWNQVGNSGIPASYLSKMCGIAPTSDIIYAIFSGTRRRDHLPAVWEQGGVYRSTNNGNSWQPVNSGITHEGGVPAPGYEIYASGTTVVFRSIEGLYSLNNSSWQKLYSISPSPFILVQ